MAKSIPLDTYMFFSCGYSKMRIPAEPIFEEMILTALKKRGHKIIRNKKYTGDGGLDGQITMNGVEYLIQAKRYKNHINAAHVREFALICHCIVGKSAAY